MGLIIPSIQEGENIVTLIYILLGLLLLFILTLYVVYLITFRGRVYHDITKTGELDGEKFVPYKKLILDGVTFARHAPNEPVTVKSYDGLVLCGRYYPADKERAILILCHGYRSIPENDFSCAIEYFHGQGFGILLIDQRAHGKSRGRTMAFGVKERRDIHTWADFVSDRWPDTPIVIEGISMGAATVLMASSEPFPKSVVGLIADCGYTSPGEIIRHVMRRLHLPEKLLYPLVRLSGRIFGGFDVEGCSALEEGRRANLPALFIHGEADAFVPCGMGERNFAAYGGPKWMVTVKKAGHGMSYVVDMPKVQGAVDEFLKRVLPEKI